MPPPLRGVHAPTLDGRLDLLLYLELPLDRLHLPPSVCEASGQPPSSPAGDDAATRVRALARAADGDADELGVGCGGALPHTWYVAGFALMLGALLGSALPAGFRPLQRLVLGGARVRGGIEEMGGWMPSHTCVSLDGMKLS